MYMKKQTGLTLIELITVVAIVGILSAIAIPSYSRYTTSASRTTGKTALQTVRSKMENFYINNKSYTTDLSKLGYGAASPSLNKAGEETAGGDAVYTVSVSNPGGCTLASCYTLTATAVNAQATNDTDCINLTLSMLGVKSATGPKGVSCWN